MFVTRRGARRSSATRASLLPGVEGHRVVGLPWPPHRDRWRSSPRSSPLACRSCAGASPGWPPSPTPPRGSRWPLPHHHPGQEPRTHGRRQRAVFFYVFISTTVGLSAAPAAVHDIASVLGASRFQRMWLVQLRRRGRRSRTGSAGRRRWPAPSSASGTGHRGLGVLLITAMQSARRSSCGRRRCSAPPSACSPALLAGSRMALARRFGSTIAESSTVKPRATGRR